MIHDARLATLLSPLARTVETVTPEAELRQSEDSEIKALADMLLTYNSDDRLVTGSFGYSAQEITQMLSEILEFEVSLAAFKMIEILNKLREP